MGEFRDKNGKLVFIDTPIQIGDDKNKLKTKILRFKIIGKDTMVETAYGDFNITLIEKC